MKLKITLIALVLIATSAVLFRHLTKPPSEIKQETIPKLSLRPVSFESLPGFEQAATKQSLRAFQLSCRAFLRQDPKRPVGSSFIHMKANDWYPACHAAMSIKSLTNTRAKQFFQTWFSAYEFYETKPVEGLFTGYHSPALPGSLTRTEHFSVPVYALPDNLVTVSLNLFNPDLRGRELVGQVKGRRVEPYYTREEINQGAIDKFTKVIVWVASHVDRLILEIEGSGTVVLNDGRELFLGYAGENGAPYTPIARYLIEQGVMTKDNASMQGIKSYFAQNPDKIKPIINKNKSFVFFRVLNQKAALGSQGVALTPGYSLAVDRKWVPMGTPIWLNTSRPTTQGDETKPFQRLMIAQDTGGAIRGMVRGDVYWGASERASEIAGKMKNKGRYWLLLPKQVVID